MAVPSSPLQIGKKDSAVGDKGFFRLISQIQRNGGIVCQIRA